MLDAGLQAAVLFHASLRLGDRLPPNCLGFFLEVCQANILSPCFHRDCDYEASQGRADGDLDAQPLLGFPC
jgi:hypothetical protein